MVTARSLLGSRMIPSRLAGTSMRMSRSGPYVRFFVIRAVIMFLSDMVPSPIRYTSNALSGVRSRRSSAEGAGSAALRSTL